MPRPQLQFWFEFASTYSHLAAQRIEALAEQSRVELVWRPFLLGPIFKAQGWDDSPFNIYAAKGAYMWRDLERESARLGVPFRRPSTFPRNGLAAARIATGGADAAWLPAFVRAVYAANFADDRDIADPAVLAQLLAQAGCRDPQGVISASTSAETKESLRTATEEAMARGIFGAPSFVADGELYWGNDRLEQALAHAKENGSDGL
jgi:2-hydroxychromene-2-carboxylate isomerase